MIDQPRAARLAARFAEIRSEWDERDATDDMALYFDSAPAGDPPAQPERGINRGDGWVASAGGDGWKAEAEGLIDGHAFYYRAWDDGAWQVRIAEDSRSAVTVGWRCGGRPGWIYDSSADLDERPDWPHPADRAGVWPRLDEVTAEFRAATVRRVDGDEINDVELGCQLIAFLFSPPWTGWSSAAAEAWMDSTHPLLDGATPRQRISAGDYRSVNMLALAETHLDRA